MIQMIKAYLKSLYFQTCQPDAVKRSFSNQWGSTTVMLQTVIKVFKGNRSRGYYPQLDPFLRHNGMKSFMKQACCIHSPKLKVVQGGVLEFIPLCHDCPRCYKTVKTAHASAYSEAWKFQSIFSTQMGFIWDLYVAAIPSKEQDSFFLC